MDDKTNNDCGNDKNNTKNMEKEIRKILKQNKCNMLYALDDIDRDKGYIGIDLYFNPDKITMQQIIDYLNNCLKLEYIDNVRKDCNNCNDNEEIPLKTFIQQNINNKDAEDFIKTLVKENVDLWEKDYQKSKHNIFSRMWAFIKDSDPIFIVIIITIIGAIIINIIAMFY